MTASFYYRALSWLCIAGIITFYAWITVVPFGWQGAPVFAVVVLGLVLAALKWGVRKPVDYWEAVAEPTQAPRVMFLIVVCLVVQLIVSAVVQLAHQMSINTFWSQAVYFLAWTCVPLAMIGMGIVRWPRRRASPPKPELLTVAVAGTLVAAGIGYLGFVAYDGPRLAPAPAQLLLSGAVLLLAAATEEVVYRVLFLTALLRASGSRSQALVLSSVIFALAHLPPTVAGPIVAGDWVQLSSYFTSFLPELVFIIGVGFLFGALWLRTGSVILITIVHAICNLGAVLAGSSFGE